MPQHHSPRQWMLVVFALFSFSLTACYSITIANKFGTATPDPANNEPGFYRQKEVVVIDTVVKVGLLKDGVMTLERCPTGGFNSVEYRATFGGVLLNCITFGKRKTIKVKYTCVKDPNE